MGIDYVKCLLSSDLINKLETHPLLEFIIEVNERTGEELPRKVAEYMGLKFIICGSKIWLTGSLHYFYNKGRHNYNDFNYKKGCHALGKIEADFGIDITSSKLENIEIGVNIKTRYRTRTILNNLLIHGTIRFKDVEGKGDYRKVKHCNYSIKAYDKAVQFKLPYEVFRFEIHFNRMRELKRFEIVYLSDLKNKSKLELLKTELLKKWDEVLLYDWTIDINVPEKEKPKDFNDWRLSTYWEGLSKSNRNKRKGIYKNFISSNSSQVQKEIRELIDKKMSALIYSKSDLFTGGERKQKATFSQFSYTVNKSPLSNRF